MSNIGFFWISGLFAGLGVGFLLASYQWRRLFKMMNDGWSDLTRSFIEEYKQTLGGFQEALEKARDREGEVGRPDEQER